MLDFSEYYCETIIIDMSSLETLVSNGWDVSPGYLFSHVCHLSTSLVIGETIVAVSPNSKIS
jgi:hypothetical protein